jgi:hypothetical protein
VAGDEDFGGFFHGTRPSIISEVIYFIPAVYYVFSKNIRSETALTSGTRTVSFSDR